MRAFRCAFVIAQVSPFPDPRGFGNTSGCSKAVGAGAEVRTVEAPAVTYTVAGI